MIPENGVLHRHVNESDLDLFCLQIRECFKTEQLQYAG